MLKCQKKKKLFQLQYVQYVFIANVKAMLIMFSTVRQKYHNIASTDFLTAAQMKVRSLNRSTVH